MSEPDYLFDKEGDAPADVRRLEQLLGRFAHGRTPRALPPARPRPRFPWWWIAPLAAAAALLVFALRPLLRGKPGEDGPRPALEIVRADGERLAIDDWVVARDEAQHLSIKELGWLTLAPGGKLHVRRLDTEQGRFYLEHGYLEAFVFPQVKARFFQVETAATTCVDLGCKYTLDVDPHTKVAHVVVTMGQVAFVENGREVFIPRGAECRAVPGLGAGTPRFTDCAPALRAKLDAFDAARALAAQRVLVAEVAAAAAEPRDTLSLWHLFGHTDEQVRGVAETALERLAGAPPERSAQGWRDHLDPLWW